MQNGSQAARELLEVLENQSYTKLPDSDVFMSKVNDVLKGGSSIKLKRDEELGK